MRKILFHLLSCVLPVKSWRQFIREKKYTKNTRKKKFFSNIASEYGYDLSNELSKCVNKNGDPIPWYTYPAIEYIQQLDLYSKSIFEYGCGNSSLFWSKLAKTVRSVENNKEWHEIIAKNAPENLEVILREGKDDYVNSILDNTNLYDIIIIDGCYRDACSEKALKRLARGGLIIFDNSDRVSEFEEYASAQRVLKENGLLQVDMHGFGPLNFYCWTTSFFFSRNYNFEGIDQLQPRKPICGISEI